MTDTLDDALVIDYYTAGAILSRSGDKWFSTASRLWVDHDDLMDLLSLEDNLYYTVLARKGDVPND